MDAKKRKALEAAGWCLGDAADFVKMTDAERQLLDARVEIALAVRQQRQALNLSQKQLAIRIKTSQPRVAKIERAASDVSLDQILKAFAAAGGHISVKLSAGPQSTKKTGKSHRSGRKNMARVIELQVAHN
jgi:predicted XRE-type DNA-binding protein